MSKIYTFTKEERLCNKKLIDELFHNGSSFLCYPFKVSWIAVSEPQPFPARFYSRFQKNAINVPWTVTCLKRRMREAYRLNKQQYLYSILEEADKKIVFSIGYIGKEISAYELIEKKMLKLLSELG